jgi:O-antigen ligase
VASISILVCAAIVVITFVTGYGDIYLSSFEKFEGGANRATSGRATIWKIAIIAMVDQPITFLTGHGFEAYAQSREFRMATHNVYLTYLYDLGAIGLVLFVAIFARIITIARSALERADELISRYMISLTFGLSAFLVSIFFSEYHTSAYLLWAYVGVMMRLAALAGTETLPDVSADITRRPENSRNSEARVGEVSAAGRNHANTI